jgi:hypothetical protein
VVGYALFALADEEADFVMMMEMEMDSMSIVMRGCGVYKMA